MLLSRRFADFVSLFRGELDVVGLPRMTEDDAVETAMILEFSDYCKPKALLIHLSDGDKVIGRPRHSYYRTRLQTLGLSVDWKKRFDPRRLGIGKINVTCKSRVIVEIMDQVVLMAHMTIKRPVNAPVIIPLGIT